MNGDETEQESFAEWLFYARKDRRRGNTKHTTRSSAEKGKE